MQELKRIKSDDMSSTEQTLDSARFTMGEDDSIPLSSAEPAAQSTPVHKGQKTPEKHQSQKSAYEDTIISLQDEISVYKGEISDMKSQIYHLVEDNEKLSKELRENVQARMRMTPESFENPEVEILRKQVSMLNEAKESVLKMWNIALQEIERLERELEKSRMGNDIDILESRINEIKRDYDKGLAELSAELNETKQNLSKTKENSLSLRKELDKYVDLNTELNVKLKEKDKEIDETKKKLQECQNQTFQSETNLTEAKKELETWEIRFKELENINQSLQEEIKTLQLREIDLERNAVDAVEQTKESMKLAESALAKKGGIDLERNAADAVEQAKESMKLAESAVFEKDVALFREHQAKKEIEGLQLAMDKIVDSASEKTKIVMENVKKKCDEKIKTLEDEIKDLETELGENRALNDRYIREKKQLQTELNQLYKEKKGTAYQTMIEELSRKLTTVEIERDKALSSVKNVELELKNSKETSLEDLKYKDTEIEQLREQLATVQRSFKSSANERFELFNKVSVLTKRCLAQQEENTAFRNKLKKDINYFESTLREQQEEHKRHIEDRCQMHNDTIFELRSLVDAHQRMVHKWKDEAKRLTEKFEREVTKLSSEVHPLKEEKKRLKKDLEDAENRLAQYEEETRNLTMENVRLNNRIQLLDELSQVSSRTHHIRDSS